MSEQSWNITTELISKGFLKTMELVTKEKKTQKSFKKEKVDQLFPLLSSLSIIFWHFSLSYDRYSSDMYIDKVVLLKSFFTLSYSALYFNVY